MHYSKYSLKGAERQKVCCASVYVATGSDVRKSSSARPPPSRKGSSIVIRPRLPRNLVRASGNLLVGAAPALMHKDPQGCIRASEKMRAY
jgi:hypothetical protein